MNRLQRALWERVYRAAGRPSTSSPSVYLPTQGRGLRLRRWLHRRAARALGRPVLEPTWLPVTNRMLADAPAIRDIINRHLLAGLTAVDEDTP